MTPPTRIRPDAIEQNDAWFRNDAGQEYDLTLVGGAGGGGAGMTVWDDGVPQQTGTILDAGYGIDASVSGSVALIRAAPPITGSVVRQRALLVPA